MASLTEVSFELRMNEEERAMRKPRRRVLQAEGIAKCQALLWKSACHVQGVCPVFGDKTKWSVAGISNYGDTGAQ